MNLLANFLSGAGAAGTAGGDVTGGGEGLLNNKLFLQYLSAAGQDILAGEPIGKNVNAVTQQNIQSQNFMKILSKMLGSGGKATIDKDGLSFKAPTETIKGVFGSEGMLGEHKAVPEPGVEIPKTNQNQSNLSAFNLTPSQLGNVNPFVGSQSGITASDLAGLTTADISNIMQLGLGAEQLKQKKVNDIIDAMYKTAKISKINKEMEGKDERTVAQKNYEYARAQGYKGSFESWEKDARTTHMKDYEEAVKSGYKGSFQTWLEKMATLGGVKISLSEKLTEMKEKEGLKGQLYFKNPDWIDDLGKYINGKEVRQKVLGAPGKGDEYNRNVAKIKTEETVGYIEGKVTAGGGEIVSRDYDKSTRTVTWTVKWPSGDTEKVKYVFK